MNEVLLRVPFANDSTKQQNYLRHLAGLAQELEDIARQQDPARYTLIPNHNAWDLYNKVGLTKIPKLVGWNLYHGWYYGTFDDFGKFLDKHHKELPDKPVLVTEFGADADNRVHSDKPLRFDKSVILPNSGQPSPALVNRRLKTYPPGPPTTSKTAQPCGLTLPARSSTTASLRNWPCGGRSVGYNRIVHYFP